MIIITIMIVMIIKGENHNNTKQLLVSCCRNGDAHLITIITLATLRTLATLITLIP
jgi:hypothetical protein